MTPQSKSKRTLYACLSLTVFALCQASAQAITFADKFVPSQLHDIPKKPVYLGIAVALAFACYRIFSLRQAKKYKARVFPKLTIRRRLYGAYSGGNFAAIEFGSKPDA